MCECAELACPVPAVRAVDQHVGKGVSCHGLDDVVDCVEQILHDLAVSGLVNSLVHKLIHLSRLFANRC